jgi:hypothetical protein
MGFAPRRRSRKLTTYPSRRPLVAGRPRTGLLYMLEGEMVYGHGDARYTMRPGDALQLDGEGVHGPQVLVALPIRFLSVVAYGDLEP